jgi:hypothetical protein
MIAFPGNDFKVSVKMTAVIWHETCDTIQVSIKWTKVPSKHSALLTHSLSVW